MQDQTTIRKETIQPVIYLKKGIGSLKYGWEIRISGDGTDQLIKDIDGINEKLKKKFPSEEWEEK